MPQITSLTNPEIKHIVKLHDSKERNKYGLCLVEGERTISTMMQGKIELIKLYVTEENKNAGTKLARLYLNQIKGHPIAAHPSLAKASGKLSVSVLSFVAPSRFCNTTKKSEVGNRTHELSQKTLDLNVDEQKIISTVSHDVMKKISTAVTPSGFLAIFAIPENPSLDGLTAGLVLAQINDPGNMGTMIRTAVSCGIKSIVIVEGVDPWAPKVIQASAGAMSWINIFQINWGTLIKSKGNLQLCALVVKDGIAPDKIKSKNALLVVGNEAHGLPKEWQKSCDQLVSIPMPGGTESLNAAIAGSIAMYLVFV